MCGITGYISRRPQREALKRMTAALRHRGPDGDGFLFQQDRGWEIGFGHRRLAIIDIEGGAQPLTDSVSGNAITYNGEVYNFAILRAALENRGHRFHTRCDTEVVLRQLTAHGTDGIDALDGMFALAFWDAEKGTLTLVRDRAGIKPLYYAPTSDGGIVFSSELTSLLEHPDCPREIDPAALQRYLLSDYVPAPQTILAGVRKLEPATYLTWRDGELSGPFSFWNETTETIVDPDTARQAVRTQLETAVREQLVADVPVGIFLSGGIDSSAVAAIASRIVPGRVRTFSIGFEDPDYDESNYARLVAAHIGSDHVERRITERDLVASLPAALASLDEPLADPSILPTWIVSHLASEHVKVCLGGDGGDELFGGYPTLKAHQLSRCLGLIPDRARKWLVRNMVNRLPNSDRRHNFGWKASRFLGRYEPDLRRRHLRWMANVDLPQLGSYFDRELSPLSLPGAEPNLSQNWPNDVMRLDFETYLPGSVLTKVDRASMSHSLEVRPPFLHRRLIETAWSLPSQFKYRNGVGKIVLKQALVDVLPHSILHRPKRGFGIPLQAWARGPLREQLAEIGGRSPLWDRTPLSQTAFKQAFLAHTQKRRDESKVLWAFLVLDDWLRRTLAR